MANVTFSDFYKACCTSFFFIGGSGQRPASYPDYYGLSSHLFEGPFWKCNLVGLVQGNSGWTVSGVMLYGSDKKSLSPDADHTGLKYSWQFLRSENHATDPNTYDFSVFYVVSSTDDVNDQTVGGVHFSNYQNWKGRFAIGKLNFDTDPTLPANGYLLIELRLSNDGISLSATPIDSPNP